MLLKQTFEQLASTYTIEQDVINRLWSEIEAAYTNEERHYHTLTHLESLIKHLIRYQKDIKNWAAMLFSVYYHDIVYNVLQNDNEEKSAQVASVRLLQLKVPVTIIKKCVEQIIATKSHLSDNDYDIQLFLDADLAILGADGPVYKKYTDAIRNEYGIYTEAQYNAGRTKVLEHFLKMDRIFKTDVFTSDLEQKAKANMSNELIELKSKLPRVS
jgi:predicted metal-dependent HD superfamily phosphohydrolase